MSIQSCSTGEVKGAFCGFEPLTANFIYCPNQFFDVCLPHYSRGTVRHVAFLLRRTLGWLDENGDPIERNVSATYRELEDAGISRGAIRPAIDAGIAGGFVYCSQRGEAKSKGKVAQSARFSLQWATEGQYVTDSKEFKGFYSGEGHRTPIPNAFFDQVVPYEPLAVIKVVGTILRHSVGYQNQFGGRRSKATLSYSYIQQFANIRDRSTLADTIGYCLERQYIIRVDSGCFNKSRSRQTAASYAVKWLEKATSKTIGSKTRPDATNRFKNQTRGSSKTRPEDRFKNQTIEITSKDNKQQRGKTGVAPVVVENAEGYELLREEGIIHDTAITLSNKATLVEIKQQIHWLDFRNPRDRAAVLVRAIEQGWSEPEAAKSHSRYRRSRKHEEKRRAEAAENDHQRIEQKKRRLRTNTSPEVLIGESVA